MLFILLFCNLFPYSISITQTIRIHHGDVLKLKCEALPLRSVYSEGTCYYSYAEKFPLSDALKTCRSIFKEATVVMERTPVLEQLNGKFDDFHGSETSGSLKRVLCAYESGTTCDQDETLLANGFCVHVDEDRNYHEGLKYCRARRSTFPIVANSEQNQLLAGLLSTQDVRGGWLLQRTAKSNNGLGWSFPGSEQSIQYFARLGDNNGGICMNEEGMVIQQFSKQCSSFGAWTFNDLKKRNTTICVRQADCDFCPVGPKPEPTEEPIEETDPTEEPETEDTEATTKRGSDVTVTSEPDSPNLGKDKAPSSDVLVPLKYFYNAFHIKHAFCTNAACMHFTNKQDVGFSPTFAKASSLGRVITHLPKGMTKMQQLCPNGYKKLKHLYFEKQAGRYVAVFKKSHTDAGWVSLEKGVCGASVPIKEYSCRMSKDFMYGQNLEWNTFYKGLARHGGKPVFWIWK